MKRFFLFLALFLSLTISAHAETQKYYAPPIQFSASFQVMNQGLSNVLGFFSEATGSFSYDSSKNEISNIRISVTTYDPTSPSRDVGKDMSTLLKWREYPEIVFMATAGNPIKDGKADIKGTLTIRGKSNPVTFSATLNQNNENKKSLGLSLKGSFRRADFDMGDPAEIPGRFGDEITLILEMKADQFTVF